MILESLLQELETYLLEAAEETAPFFKPLFKKKAVPSFSLPPKTSLNPPPTYKPVEKALPSSKDFTRPPLPFLTPLPVEKKEEVKLTPSVIKSKEPLTSLGLEGPLQFLKKKNLHKEPPLSPSFKESSSPQKESVALCISRANPEEVLFFEKVQTALLTKTDSVYLLDVSELETPFFKEMIDLLKIKIILAPSPSIEFLQGKGVLSSFIPLHPRSLYEQKPQEKAKLWNAACQAILKDLPVLSK